MLETKPAETERHGLGALLVKPLTLRYGIPRGRDALMRGPRAVTHLLKYTIFENSALLGGKVHCLR